jgi:cytochrome oxidase Cu insertion factor (SCO1/SenC/PrrC family)
VTAEKSKVQTLVRSVPDENVQAVNVTIDPRDPESADWPNTVALCAMMKTEHAEDVVEWLDYHR